ncbi:MAG: glycosyltransferase family A protein [Candidatus Acidiferrales bacterium]
MKITVILCTYNRCGELANVLNSLAASTLPDSTEWEVLVVDNNSTDQTRDVASDFSIRFPGRFRYVFESRPGKSFALNAGIHEACGDVLAFVDDDVTVEPTWLQNLTAPLRDGDWAATGGRTLPANSFTRPRWFAPELLGVLCAHFDLGDKPCELSQAPYGANMAVRKEMFEKYGRFRTDLGPSPNSNIPRPNEDTEFGRRLMNAGQRLRYEPSAVVHHPVLEERLQKEYFLGWWFDYGRASMREVQARRKVLGIPRSYFNVMKCVMVHLPRNALRWILTFNPRSRFYSKCFVWMAAGLTVEAYRRSFGAKSTRSPAVE